MVATQHIPGFHHGPGIPITRDTRRRAIPHHLDSQVGDLLKQPDPVKRTRRAAPRPNVFTKAFRSAQKAAWARLRKSPRKTRAPMPSEAFTEISSPSLPSEAPPQQCPAKHGMDLVHGMPYKGRDGATVTCNVCRATGLETGDPFYHCGRCYFDCCAGCCGEKVKVQAGRRRPVCPDLMQFNVLGNRSLAVPSCPGHHTLERVRGLPIVYSRQPGHVVCCNACSATHLEEAQPGFLHCAICSFDLCQACAMGKRTRPSTAPSAPPPRPPATPPSHRPPPKQPEASCMRDLVQGWVRLSSPAGSRRKPPACPTIDDAAPAVYEGLTLRQAFPVGTEVELTRLGPPLDGMRGKVVGHSRGRAGILLTDGREMGLLPHNLQRPGRATKRTHIPIVPGAEVEVTGSGQRVTVEAVEGGTAVVSGGRRVATRDLAYPVGTMMLLNNSERVRVTGYARGRVGVVSAEDGRVMGVPPDQLTYPPSPSVARPSSVANSSTMTPPQTPPGPTAPTPRPPNSRHHSDDRRRMVDCLKRALVKEQGGMAALRRVFAGTTEISKQAFRDGVRRLGLSDLDDSTLDVAFSALDTQKKGSLDTHHFLQVMCGGLSRRRERDILRAFSAVAG
eukprot:Sspe_Gene.10947::Locus_3695_Transcript_1_1_Confidence_1.000_Length_1891::g.10947::m.10947